MVVGLLLKLTSVRTTLSLITAKVTKITPDRHCVNRRPAITVSNCLDTQRNSTGLIQSILDVIHLDARTVLE